MSRSAIIHGFSNNQRNSVTEIDLRDNNLVILQGTGSLYFPDNKYQKLVYDYFQAHISGVRGENKALGGEENYQKLVSEIGWLLCMHLRHLIFASLP